MYFTTSRTAFAASLLALADAHAVMNVPEPYGFGSGLTNGPMTQAAFPCKKDEVQFTGGNKTTWSGGQSQPLHLVSAATHGGGSCFIAMTYETPGSPAFEELSNWKAVYTLPGDCPATTPGNLESEVTQIGGYPSGPQCSSPDSDQSDCVHSFNVPMPDELKDGDATFGWVWLSRVTTETYMNCAPITVSGAKNNGKYDSLPSLEGMSFTGLSGGGVPGASGSGSSGSSSSGGSSSPASGSSSSGSSSSEPGSSSSGSSGTGSGSTGASSGSGTDTSGSAAGGAASPAASASPVSGSPAGNSNPGGTFAEGGSSGAGADAGAPTSATPSAAPAPAGASGGTTASSGACTSGAIQCSGSTWSMCSNGAWVDMGSVGGLTCSDGTLNKRAPYKPLRA